MGLTVLGELNLFLNTFLANLKLNLLNKNKLEF